MQLAFINPVTGKLYQFSMEVLSYKEASKRLKTNDLTHVVSIADTEGSPYAKHADGFDGLACDKLKLSFHDEIDTPKGPQEKHLLEIISFAKGLKKDLNDGRSCKYMVHCMAGRSRSAACALVTLGIIYGKGREKEAMQALLETRPIACPNACMVKLADQILGSNFAAVLELIPKENRL